MAKDKASEPALVCDFTSGAVRHRFLYGGGRGQALPRAIGMKGGVNPRVVDATAGLGGDAFLLAALGATVTLIEVSPQIHRLLADAMDRAREAGGEVAEVIARMTLLHGDSREILPTLDPAPEVVLVDPMHPERKKSALVKQEMRLVREIVGDNPDAADLMRVALATATKRVVLKWPRLAAPMPGIRAPSHQIVGKSTRYDVFMQV
jgi:16S rRNA (guanine1516-N2)-methyltransferase